MLKKIILAVVLMACSVSAYARGHWADYARKGGQNVLSGGFISTTTVDRTFPSCTYTVYKQGTTAQATIFSDSAGTAKTNPATAGTDGRFDFYSDETSVDITFSGTGITTSCGGAGQQACLTAFTWADIKAPQVSAVSSVNIKDYGAKVDGIRLTDAAITATTTTLTSVSAVFVAADVGKAIIVYGAGAANAPMVTTIATFVSATSVTTTATATTTVSGATCFYGTDDYTAINASIAALANGGVVNFGRGITISGTLITNSTRFLTLAGDGSTNPSGLTLVSTSATGGVILGEQQTGIRDMAIVFGLNGGAAYGVKVDKGPGNVYPTRGADFVTIQNIKVKGASTNTGSHGLWLLNSFDSRVTDVFAPNGGGDAFRLESVWNSSFINLHTSVGSSTLERDYSPTVGAPVWNNGLNIAPQTGCATQSADSNEFWNTVIDNITTSDLLISGTCNGNQAARNSFYGGIFGGSATNTANVSGAWATKFFGTHAEVGTTPWSLGALTDNVLLFGCSGAVTILSGAIGDQVYGQNGAVTANAGAIGTKIMGVTGVVTDNGTNTSIDTVAFAGGAISIVWPTLTIQNNAGTLTNLIVNGTGAASAARESIDLTGDKPALDIRAYNSGFTTFTHAGIALANWAELWLDQVAPSPNGLLIGVNQNKPVVFANNNVEVMRLNTNQMLQLTLTLQANLGAPPNGSVTYCSDCNRDATCTGGGTGALAKRLASGWICN